MDDRTSAVHIDLDQSYPEIRELVRKICARFPGEYWRELEEGQSYPTEFVAALTEAGLLGSQIPEEYGGLGLPLGAASATLEEIHAAGCNAGACHAQMYIMGTVLRHGSPEQKKKYLPDIAAGRLRLQAFGVTEPTTGSDTTKLKTRAEKRNDHYLINGQKVWTSRALQSDLMLLLARTTPLDQVKKKSDGLSVFLVDVKSAVGNGMEIKPLRAMINHNTTEVFFNSLRVPFENLVGEEGKGFRYILDSMNAERILVPSEAIGDGRWFIEKASEYSNERTVFDRPDRPEPGRPVSDRPRLCGDRSRISHGAKGHGAVRGRQALRTRGQHGQAPRFRGVLARRRGRTADPWRFRFRHGI